MYEDAFGDTVGFALSVLIISGLAVSLLVMALARLGEYFVEYNEKKDEEAKFKRESDAKKLAEPSKQQYDLKDTEIDFSINTKDAIVVTEVVYAD